MTRRDPTLRFTDRADAYARNRPGYPAALTAVLAEELGLERGWVIADVGSGTGLSAEPFLAHGNEVWAVEPNDAMRRAAEARLGTHPRFHSVKGTAERTGLPERGVDLVVAAQAFHWFDPAPTRAELRRILRDPPRVAVFWNMRRNEASALMRGYEALIDEFRTDRDGAPRRDLEAFFGGPVRERRLEHEQRLDRAGLEGLLCSASYAPAPDHPRHAAMLEALRALFERSAEDGRIRFLYETRIYLGELA